MNRIAAVVLKNSTFKVLKDLKGAKASFTGYRSIGKFEFHTSSLGIISNSFILIDSFTGWNAFVTWMRNELDESQVCSDAWAVAKFFKDSCVLGWRNESRNKEFPINLYSLCKQGEDHERDVQFRLSAHGIHKRGLLKRYEST